MAFTSYIQMVFAAALSFVALTTAFVVPAPATRLGSTSLCTSVHSSRCSSSSNGRRTASRVLRMSEEEAGQAAVEEASAQAAQADPAEQATQSVRTFFAPNENVRRGASRDQDGKSNVWAVEPKMRVMGKDAEPTNEGNLVVVGGLVALVLVGIVATIAFLPSPDSL